MGRYLGDEFSYALEKQLKSTQPRNTEKIENNTIIMKT